MSGITISPEPTSGGLSKAEVEALIEEHVSQWGTVVLTHANNGEEVAWGERYIIDTTGGAFAVKLPTAAGNKGKSIKLVMRAGAANALTLEAHAGQEIWLQGKKTATVGMAVEGQYLDSTEVTSDGTNPICE